MNEWMNECCVVYTKVFSVSSWKVLKCYQETMNLRINWCLKQGRGEGGRSNTYLGILCQSKTNLRWNEKWSCYEKMCNWFIIGFYLPLGICSTDLRQLIGHHLVHEFTCPFPLDIDLCECCDVRNGNVLHGIPDFSTYRIVPVGTEVWRFVGGVITFTRVPLGNFPSRGEGELSTCILQRLKDEVRKN